MDIASDDRIFLAWAVKKCLTLTTTQAMESVLFWLICESVVGAE